MFPGLAELSMGVNYHPAIVFNAAAITHLKGFGYVEQLLWRKLRNKGPTFDYCFGNHL